jgi:hypothetical protein
MYIPEDCPLTQLLICKRTAFHNIIRYDLPQTEKEKVARSWMESYVRNVLLKKGPTLVALQTPVETPVLS